MATAARARAPPPRGGGADRGLALRGRGRGGGARWRCRLDPMPLWRGSSTTSSATRSSSRQPARSGWRRPRRRTAASSSASPTTARASRRRRAAALPLRRPPAGREAGEGLGLHIVKHLTDRLGGEASIGNRPAGGVEAVLRFPPRGRRRAAGGGRRPARASTSPGSAVLLAEDNPTNQMVASQMLRALNAEVTVCADGVEALERFEQRARSTWWWSTSRCRGSPGST